jgi:hypothetical protein
MRAFSHFFVSVMVLSCRTPTASHWPEVAPMHVATFFSEGRLASGNWTIYGPEGQQLYRIECRSRDQEGHADFIYSGDFECRLVSLYSHEAHSSLFLENPHATRDWESRARFLAEDLVGACAQRPGWGSSRQFRLRGMRVTLALSDISVERTTDRASGQGTLELRSFWFTLAVEPDAQATTAIAATSEYGDSADGCASGPTWR